MDRPTVALIYDFDGTLSPANMQEFGLLQTFDKDPGIFWNKSNRMSSENDASEILCYMKTMVDEARKAGVHLTKENFRKFGSMVRLYPGVKEWFGKINAYGDSRGLQVEHYINSSGLTEMIEGTEIYNEFKKVYACSFLYENGEAVWPGVAVDYTAKTQFLFKINKGVMSIRDHTLVNRYLPEKDRPVPFSRMIYFGDGATDIPCMRLVKQFGGHSIAVYNPDGKEKEKSERLLYEQRVHFACPADYSEGKKIYQVVTAIIDKIRADLSLSSISAD
ncbi:MAG TPA: haloacid dehalogenase-like hydrolase [Candidatus Coprenecus stercoravium]|uniref:Haloacid dehalogenase-like hydrolase n=1 Tax=Candidatus Coprenecus stercoravium TaxID=2840735 RepID=A0A9D2GRF5_9BACT|nr:haloacid dehalogenase-like hydrolase [Candidatus Coprenecus stercoravium]